MKRPQRSVSLIGFGNWGSSLAHGLREAAVPLREIIVSAMGKHSGSRGLPLTTLDRAQLDADILWLCVPDAAIERVTRNLVQRMKGRGSNLKGKIVVHSSGALDVQVLQAAVAAGASVASVHPVMSFPTRTSFPLGGVPFGVEAEPTTGRLLHTLVRRLGGRPFAIQASKKALYHAIGMLSSPLLVSHLVAAHQAASLAGFTPRQAQELIEPIARATLDNVFSKGPGQSFSGPIARGDGATIRLHLQALQAHPMLADVYRSLALYALEALPGQRKAQTRRVLLATRPR